MLALVRRSCRDCCATSIDTASGNPFGVPFSASARTSAKERGAPSNSAAPSDGLITTEAWMAGATTNGLPSGPTHAIRIASMVSTNCDQGATFSNRSA